MNVPQLTLPWPAWHTSPVLAKEKARAASDSDLIKMLDDQRTFLIAHYWWDWRAKQPELQPWEMSSKDWIESQIEWRFRSAVETRIQNNDRRKAATRAARTLRFYRRSAEQKTAA